MYSSELFSPELPGEKFENNLENSGNLVTQKCSHPVTDLEYVYSLGGKNFPSQNQLLEDRLILGFCAGLGKDKINQDNIKFCCLPV